jgi:hypothetical protein
MVKTASDFTAVATEFFQFMGDIAQNHATATASEIDDIILVTHNSQAFDIPFLMRSIARHNLECLWRDSHFGFTIDTLHISKRLFQNKATRQPTNQKLGTLFQVLTGKEMENSHCAMSYVKALYSVNQSKLFWTNRKESLQISIINGGPSEQAGVVICLPSHDSNVSDLSDSEDDNNRGRKRRRDDGNANSSDEDEEGNNQIAGDHWKKQDFIPTDNPSEIFLEAFTSSCWSGVTRTGLQVYPAMANSPIKAWRLVFTAGILEKIVSHTNKYGYPNAKDWSPITKKDLTDLFLMSDQKRKDKPSNWFSDNPLLESKIAKRVTTGRKFGKMLRYLQCCDPDEDGKNDKGEYDPSYKIMDLQNELEKRWTTIFVPGQQLSLDETLLRAFSHMKFKVQIISKAARYGIKLYVVTDAVTSFVLGVIVYTGKFTYLEATTESTKKTVQVVQQLCEPFRGTFCTFYIDWFNSSVDLLKQLEDMKLYTTGTVLSN